MVALRHAAGQKMLCAAPVSLVAALFGICITSQNQLPNTDMARQGRYRTVY